jgi:2-polyprenyl-3-methyl-5-hydroxy-6-metoxy-1,4-benzoquinol methylase
VSGNLLKRVCPVCESAAFREVLIKENLRLVRCTNCSMVYTNPIDEGWATGLYYDNLAVPFYLSPNKVESDYAPVRFARELEIFRRFCKLGSVLDVGCSTGAFLFQLKSKFPGDYNVLGVDVAGPALEYAAQKGVPVLRESFLTRNFGQQRFSAVTFWAVMEHLANPRQFLFKAASILESDGFLFLLVPNFRSLATRLLDGKYRYIFPQHVNYFTLSTLKQFVANASDLRIVRTCSTHFNPIVIWQDWRGGGDFVSDDARASLLKRTTAYKQNPILRPIKLGLGALEAGLGYLNLADNIVLVLQRR